MKKIQKVTTKGLVIKEGKAFMIRDQAGNWELPGGKVDIGEHPKDALKREFTEELDIQEVKVGKIINVWDFNTEFEGTDCQFIVLVYICEADLDKVTISNEHNEYRWIGIGDLSNFQMRQGYKDTLTKYMKSI